MATIRARYEKGVLTPLEPLDLEEGREVKLDVTLEELPQESVSDDGKSASDTPPEEAIDPFDTAEPPPGMHPTLWWIANLHKKYPGAFDDLPPDLSVNYKHYLYGHPKVSEEE